MPGDLIHAADCPTLGTPEQFTGGHPTAGAKDDLLIRAHAMVVAYAQLGGR
jgi:hypothetical protein